jgi:hypothetical protein
MLRTKIATALLMAMTAGAASAAPVVYQGLDLGAGSLAAAPNSQAASDAFDLATGALTLIDFDGNNTGATFSAGTVTSDIACGFALCGGNTTSGGSNFLRVSGGITTITFDSAVDSFGAYFSGWQIVTQTITYTDGNTEVLDMGPANLDDGGMIFFGFVDAGASIASIEYNALNDIVALDDIRFGNANVIPLPAGVVLLITGLAGFGALRRRKTS